MIYLIKLTLFNKIYHHNLYHLDLIPKNHQHNHLQYLSKDLMLIL
jgi:hypothetical protein